MQSAIVPSTSVQDERQSKKRPIQEVQASICIHVSSTGRYKIPSEQYAYILQYDVCTLMLCVYVQARVNIPSLSESTIRRDIAASGITMSSDIQV